MDIGKALAIVGLTALGCVLGALGARITVNVIDGKPLLAAPNPTVIGVEWPTNKEQPKLTGPKDDKKK